MSGAFLRTRELLEPGSTLLHSIYLLDLLLLFVPLGFLPHYTHRALVYSARFNVLRLDLPGTALMRGEMVQDHPLPRRGILGAHR